MWWWNRGPNSNNDVEFTEKVARAFTAQFGEHAQETKPAGASEDFSVFGREL
jgi:metal-dependent amidase/aminoacylase/carboxypeptidase family protein